MSNWLTSFAGQWATVLVLYGLVELARWSWNRNRPHIGN